MSATGSSTDSQELHAEAKQRVEEELGYAESFAEAVEAVKGEYPNIVVDRAAAEIMEEFDPGV